jgi:hypothetical protein
MLDLLLSIAAACLGSLALGQGVLALCGAREWSWLAAPIGFAAMILIAVPAIHVPGRSATMAAVAAVLAIAGVALMVMRPAHRPPIGELAAGAPVALLALVPFVASGRVGTLGMSFDNDMGEHLLMAEAYRSAAVAITSPLLPSYPLGPHAFAAALSEGLRVPVDYAFAGISAAAPVLTAWTAMACVARVRWLGRAALATVVGMPFLVAAYYGEGSFKEPMEALFALAVAIVLAGFQPPLRPRLRWIPLGVVMAGAVSVYSIQGLAWPVALIFVWLVGRALRTAPSRGIASAWHELIVEIVPGLVGLVVLIVLLAPQLPRIHRFASQGLGGAVAKANLGNLIGPLPVWEAFGTWNVPDLRMPASPPFTAGMWTAFVLALALIGGLRLLRGERWMLPAAGLVSIALWAYLAHTQSPYVAAKALVIASPLLLLLAASALIGESSLRVDRVGWIVTLLAVVLVGRVVDSSWEALRYSKVASRAHLTELRSLVGTLGKEPTLFLGNDDFYAWDLAGARVTAAYFAGVDEEPARPEKPIGMGEPIDFDSVTAPTLNSFHWFITTRDAAASEAPAQIRPVRLTRNYELWRRVGQVVERHTLAEGAGAAATLDCSSASGKAVLADGGIAAIRAPSEVVPLPLLAPGARYAATLPLTPGTWELETPYTSPLPLKVTSAGLAVTLPANLERQGPRWPIGHVTVTSAESVTVVLETVAYWLTPASDIATPVSLVATPVGRDRIVPIREACGKLVDWYRNA